jgi:hydroxymethylpyrimidine kinase/phosphomethylpyrimidine kinase
MSPSAAPVPGGGIPFDERPAVLCLAGVDPSGGAGLARDIMVLDELGGHPLPVPTTLTVQDSKAVAAVIPVAGDAIRRMAETVIQDFRVRAVKVGALATEEVVASVADVVGALVRAPVVVDPVLRSSSGHELLTSAGIRALKDRLLRSSTVLTPNREEAEALTGMSIADADDLREAARRLVDTGAEWVLVKAHGLPGGPLDLLWGRGTSRLYRGERLHSDEVHGTGCVFSTSLAYFLAVGLSVPRAVARAKRVAEASIRSARRLGRGMALPGSAAEHAPEGGGDTR